MYIHDEFSPRVNLEGHSAWLKIGEGCNHQCAFCIIPTLRGKMRSRSIPSLVAEAERFVAQGVREIGLVSQDSTAFGRDLADGTDLGGLLRALAKVEGLTDSATTRTRWPSRQSLAAIRDEPKVCSYLDMPLQHASGPMLKAMRRGVTRAGQERILDKLRQRCRTSRLAPRSSWASWGDGRRFCRVATLLRASSLSAWMSLPTSGRWYRRRQAAESGP